MRTNKTSYLDRCPFLLPILEHCFDLAKSPSDHPLQTKHLDYSSAGQLLILSRFRFVKIHKKIH